jgi:DSF synthase
MPVEYTVLSSGVPGVFNLGGDLDLFISLIEARNRERLLAYGKACIDVLYRNYLGHGLPVTTISLVQGECLGGGFEAALSSDIVVAERHARFGFPEILFNLFPGMGAYSFLDRKVGRRVTEELLSTGKIYSADDMLALGVIDYVVESGQGEAELASLIRRLSRSRNGLVGIAAARRRVNGIAHQELLDVVHLWVDAALRLTSRDLKLMQRLVSRQNDITASHQIH